MSLKVVPVPGSECQKCGDRCKPRNLVIETDGTMVWQYQCSRGHQWSVQSSATYNVSLIGEG
mgnify:CR=1 FL=1